MLMIGITVSVFWPCMQIAYAHSEEQFNERVFGYFISHLEREAYLSPNQFEAKVPSDFYSILWMQTAAEYRALVLQTFRSAEQAIIAANKANNTPTNAIIMDIDETVLDNTAFNAYLTGQNIPFSEELWDWWIASNSHQVLAVPGAVNFVSSIMSNQIRVIFITNRSKRLQSVTIERMVQLGFGTETYLLENIKFKERSSGKEERREAAFAQFNILASIGDNLADFSDIYEAGRSGLAQRWKLVQAGTNAANWGEKWFVLPNPAYGDWTRTITATNLLMYSFELNPRLQ